MRANLKIILLLMLCLSRLDVSAQLYNPVKWTFSAVRQDDRLYTVLFAADIAPGWHVYSHVQPKKAVARPLTISFNPGQGIHLEGKAMELGKLEKFYDESLGLSAYQYSGRLTVRQALKIKNAAPTRVTGILTYQTCNDERCLPPEDVEFAVNIP